MSEGRRRAAGVVLLLSTVAFTAAPALAQTGTESPSPSPEPTASPQPSSSPEIPTHVPTDPPDDPLLPALIQAPIIDPLREGRATEVPTSGASHVEPRWTPDPRWGGYSTRALDRVAAQRSAAGWSEEQIALEVYAPFPIAGPATWADSWGAPRYTGGYHPHHGQDISCSEGTPLVAVDDGILSLASDPLGGLTARLTVADGSFWYYAHLSAWPPIPDGTPVTQGTIIGRCGRSGDATAPHLHFALFTPDSGAEDPMPFLVRWLHQAEVDLGLAPSAALGIEVGDSIAFESASEDDPTLPIVLVEAQPPPVAVVAGPAIAAPLAFVFAFALLPLPLASRRLRKRVARRWSSL